MKKRLTKSLSILLAFIMLFTSINLAMPVVADAAASTAQINALKNALAAANSAGVIQPGSNSYTVSGQGSGGATITDHTAEGYIYNVAKAMYTVFRNEAKVNSNSSDNTWWRVIMWNRIKSLTGNVSAYNNLIQYLLWTNEDWGRNNRKKRSKVESKPSYPSTVTITTNRTIEAGLMQAYPTYSSLPASAASVNSKFVYSANTGRNDSNTGLIDRYYWLYFSALPTSSETPSVATGLVVALRDFGSYFTPELLSQNPTQMSWAELEAITVANAEAMEKTDAIRSALTRSANYNKVMNNYFNMTAINNFVQGCLNARNAYRAEAFVDLYYDMDAGVFDLTVDWDNVAEVMSLRETINEIDALTEGMSDSELNTFIRSIYPFFNITEVRAFQADFDYNYEKSLLQYVKDNADDYMDAHYNGIDSEADEYYTNIPNANFDIMYGSFQGYEDILGRSYAPENFNSVFGNASGAQYIINFLNLLREDALLREYNIFHAQYYRYFTGLYAEDISKKKAEDVIERHIDSALEKRDEYFDKYNDAIAEYGQAQADEIFPGIQELDANLNTHINNIKIALGARFKAQVDVTKALVPADMQVTWHNFNLIQTAVKNLEHVIYEEYGTTNYIDAQAKQDYQWLQTNVLNQIAAWTANNGFDRFEQTKYDDQYPTRQPNTDDFARADDQDYVVTDEKLANIVPSLEKILLSEELGVILDEEGGFGEKLSGLVAKELYSDSLVNTLIETLYPEMLGQFSELLEDLPKEFKVSFITIKVTYNKDLRDISRDLGLAIYPDRLAEKVDMFKFPTAWAELNEAGQSWDNLYDEEDEFELYWGIDDVEDPAEKEARFKDALAVAFAGIEPLFLTLLNNKPLDIRSKDVASAVGGTIDANVYLRSSGNEGYAKTFVPIFELLNIPASQIPSRAQANAVSNARGIVDLIFNPLIYFLENQLATAPIETLVDLLPNLAYALSMDMLLPTLGGLSTTLNYQIEMDYKLGTYSQRDTIDIDLQEMLDLEDLGLDISGFDGLIKMLLEDDDEEAEPIELPFLNAGLIATLGELKTASSKRPSGTRYTVEADRADVVFYMLNYFLDAVGDEAFINTLLSILSGDDEDVEEGEEDEGLSPEILEILAGLGDEASRGDIIAAVVELFNPAEYEMRDYNWAEPVADYSMAYLGYHNNWTKEKADYLSNNIDNIVTAISETMGMDEDIPTMLTNMIDELLNADTLKSITDMLAGLELDEEMAMLIDGILGVDLSAWSAYGEDYEPVINNRDDFFNELYTILEPIAPLLGFLLTGQDIVAFDEGLQFKGYEGYATGLLPLLEALGCEDLMTPAEYKAAIANDQKAAISAILDPIIGLIDNIAANPASTILEILPKVLYFLESGGLATSLQNITHSLLVLLDTIRPIYNISISTILEMVAGDDEDAEEGEEAEAITYLDIERIDEITLDWIFGLLEEQTGLELSNILGNMIENMSKLSEAYTSKNGEVAYTVNLDAGDVITILLSSFVELLYSENNQEKIAEMLEIDEGIIPTILTVINSSVVEIQSINWFYFDESIDYADAFANPETVVLPPRSITYLSYPNNWNQGTATYIDENLTSIIDMILGLLDEDNGTIADMLDGVLDIYNDETVNSLISAAQSLTSSLDATLLELVDVVLDLDLSAWNAYDEDYAWGVTDRESFVAAMATALAPLERLFDWILCADDISYFSNSEGGDLITINGTQGYAYGLVPILEALGVVGLLPEDEFTAADFATKIETLLGAVLTRVDNLLADPVNELLALVPNLIYFLNADGLTVSLNNLLGGIYNIIEDIQPIEEINIDEELGFPLSDLSLMNLLDFASESLGISLDPLSNFLENFYLGEISFFLSASNEIAFRMAYSDDESRKDLITIIFSLLLQVLDYDENTTALKEMLGEDVYAALKNILHLGEFSLEMLEIDWIHKEAAGTGEVFNALETSELFDVGYGALYTRDKAEYIDENIDDLFNNIIYLLGLEINDTRVTNLEELLTSFLGTSLYTQDNAVSVLEMVQDLIADIEEVDPQGHIRAIINESLGIDLNAWNDMDENSFNVPDNDKDAFIDAISQILAPLNPVLGWFLCDDDFAFFVDENEQDYFYLAGAKGYEYGILPILEALECENIVSPEAFVADRDNMLKNILDPILSKVDVILADPANEIMNILPAITYFINSNGLDVSFKNLLNPIRVVLNAIEPVAEVDLYDVIGIKLDDFNFETMLGALLDSLYESTGYDLTPIAMDAFAEMTVGVVVEKESLSAMNDYTRYTMEYAGADRADMTTVVLRLLVQFITMDENADMIKAMLRENLDMDESSFAYVSTMVDGFVYAMETPYGMDAILYAIYYINYGLNTGATELIGLQNDLNGTWSFVFDTLAESESTTIQRLYEELVKLLEEYLPGAVTPDGVLAPNGFIAFFQSIGAFFQRIFSFFGSLFN